MTNTLCWDRDLQRIYITAGPGSSRRRGLESAVVTEDMECLAGLEVSGWGGGVAFHSLGEDREGCSGIWGLSQVLGDTVELARHGGTL